MLVWGWMLPHGRTCQAVHSKSMAFMVQVKEKSRGHTTAKASQPVFKPGPSTEPRLQMLPVGQAAMVGQYPRTWLPVIRCSSRVPHPWMIAVATQVPLRLRKSRLPPPL